MSHRITVNGELRVVDAEPELRCYMVSLGSPARTNVMID
jgi:hypothetical protein